MQHVLINRGFDYIGEATDRAPTRFAPNPGTVADTAAVLTKAFQDVSREWLAMSQGQFVRTSRRSHV